MKDLGAGWGRKQAPRRFEVAQRVLSMYGGGDRYYPGAIAAAHGDGTYDIAFDDGDADCGVAARKIVDEAEGMAAGLAADDY